MRSAHHDCFQTEIGKICSKQAPSGYELKDFVGIAENIIDDLISEIEDLEDEIDV